MAWATAALDTIGIIPGGGNVLHGIQLGAAVVAAGVSAFGDPASAGLSATGAGLAIADKAGTSIAVHGLEMIPLFGNFVSLGATVNDVIGKEGLVANYKSCMAGAS